MTSIISIVNQKGGVGKTTTAVNLSAGLSILGKKALLIDIDPQGNATSGLGIGKEKLVNSIYNVFIDDTPVENTIRNTGIENLHMIPANNDLIGANVELHNIENKEKILRNKLEKARYKYDYILIDCPPSLGYLTLNALVASDSVLIPLQCEFFAMEGLAQLINTFNLVKSRLNNSLIIEGILLTMFDGSAHISTEVEKEVRTHFTDKVFKTSIPRDTKLTESPSFGKPIMLYDIISKSSTAYMLLGKEVLLSNAKTNVR
ncbi:MAG TPA: AAA family ATPase [bacterium]|nr:AAA family ATPase [bacterium]